MPEFCPFEYEVLHRHAQPEAVVVVAVVRFVPVAIGDPNVPIVIVPRTAAQHAGGQLPIPCV